MLHLTTLKSQPFVQEFINSHMHRAKVQVSAKLDRILSDV
jgi:hypothetical protein